MSDSQLQDLFRDHHPSEALLRSWLAGNASDHDASQINVHVAQCSHCELILLRLESSDQDFLNCFRAYRDHWELGQTGLKQTKVEDDRFAATLIESASSSARHFSAVSRSHLLGKFLPGTKLAGRYQIVSLIGRGGMGEVYRADDMKLGQTVALKFLTDRAGRSEQRLQYFLDEVRLSQRLSHPYICRVHDVVEYESHLFLSMEYVEGENLSELLKRTGPLTESKAIELAGQLCQGLAAAHDAGVLHRDLKPANIMVDHRGRARIADFGLAREHGVLNPREGIVGTPLYMAPEQLKSNQTSVQSDLYSLGLIVYEMFTGSKAHQAKDVDEISKLHESGVAIQCVSSGSRDCQMLGERSSRPIQQCGCIRGSLTWEIRVVGGRCDGPNTVTGYDLDRGTKGIATATSDCRPADLGDPPFSRRWTDVVVGIRLVSI